MGSNRDQSTVEAAPTPEVVGHTFRRETYRAVTTGVLESASTTFMLLVAVRYFDCGQTVKGLIASGGSVGLILSPLIVTFVENRGLRVNIAASWVFAFGALAFALIGLVPHVGVFLVGGILGLSCSTVAIPLVTQIYQRNYPPDRRGRLFSTTALVRILSVSIFSAVAGWALDGNIQWSRALFWIFSGSCVLSALWLRGIPSSPLQPSKWSHPLRSLRFVRSDPVFRRTLTSWMLMGFGNLMMFPLRVEYLSNPVYGIQADESTIALLVGALPAVVRLALSRVWGALFDRLNFFALRIVLNGFFVLGILVFFGSESLVWIAVGAAFYGVAQSGGEVAWNLWVTKLAPPGRVAEYMSVHTFFTGVRGLIAPIIAFHAVSWLGPAPLGIFAAMMVIGASAMLIPLARRRGD